MPRQVTERIVSGTVVSLVDMVGLQVHGRGAIVSGYEECEMQVGESQLFSDSVTGKSSVPCPPPVLDLGRRANN